MKLKFVVTLYSGHCVAGSSTLLIFNKEALRVNYKCVYPLIGLIRRYDCINLNYNVALVNLILSGLLV